jgi:integrase
VLASRKLEVEKARVLGFTPPGDDSFDELAERYLAYQRPRLSQRSFERDSGVVEKHLKPRFRGKVAAIRKADVQNYLTERSEKASAGSVAKEFRTLSHMLNLAVEWEIIPVNPAKGVKAPKVPPGRVRYLNPPEVEAVLDACPAWLRPIVVLAVATGMRRGELLSLRVMDVDFAQKRVWLPQTKNGTGRAVYLNETARSALAPLVSPSMVGTQRVFGAVSADYITQRFRDACRQAGILDFRFHDLRHTAASWLAMSGSDIHSVATLLGHRDLRMASRYRHLSPSFLAVQVGRLDKVFTNLSHHSVTAETGPTDESMLIH